MKETLKQILSLVKNSNYLKLKNKNLFESEKILSELNSNGFTIIENYYTDKKCNELIENINELIEQKIHLFKIDKNSNDFRLNGADLLSEKIKEFKEDKFLQDISDRFLQKKSSAFFTLAAKISEKKNSLGSGGDWHRDKPLPKQIKAMIYLTDVDKTNGPFEYLNNSDKWNSLIDGTLNFGLKDCQTRLDNSIIDSKFLKSRRYKKTTITGKKGTLLLFNSFGIHRGAPLVSGNRFALTNYYFPDDLINRESANMKNKFKIPILK